MEQFNLKKYLKNPNRKIVTRDGKDVRIICTDKKEYGKISETINCIDDLFFAPEKHKGWVNLYKGNDYYFLGSTLFYQSASEAVSHIMKNRNYIRTIKVKWEE